MAGLLGLLVLTEARREARVRDGKLAAVAELDGPEVALALSTGSRSRPTTHDMPLSPTCSRRLGRSSEAKEAYDAAIASTQNSAERAYLSRKRGELV